MSSDDEEMDYDSPDEENQTNPTIALPALSKKIYNKTYDDFKKWYDQNGAKKSISEDLMCTYFTTLLTKHKPSTLWNLYSMLKSTINLNDNVDIAVFCKLTEFLKKVNVGYKPEKTKKFTEEDIDRFINDAPDEQFLHAKVICIFGINGVNSSRKLITVMIEHVKQYADMFLVSIPKATSNAKFSFTINGTFFNIVKKYAALRPANTKDNRFFLQYKAGKCSEQPIGINKFSDSPRKIAQFLKLPKPELYTVNAFRINSTKAVANVSCGWKSSTVEHSMRYSLDYETGLLRTSTVDCTSEPVSAVPSFPGNKQPETAATSAPSNDDKTAHICFLTCGEVKCAKEENERDVLHAFDVMKPPDYAIAEVTPAQFASDPCCWIVAYTHNSEPVSAFNADETFDDITTSIPYNVTVIQEYIRGNSSQLAPAYVVVYAVACRCQKESANVFSFTVNEIKCEI